MSKIICLKCDKENEEEAQYCGFCGSRTKNKFVDDILSEVKQKLDSPKNTNKSIFESKTFWIIAGIVVLIYTAYKIGNADRSGLTLKDLKKNESVCAKWSGQILRDSDGKYVDCAINKRLESSY